MTTLQFDLSDGTSELVQFGSPRYWELYQAGLRPVGEVPAGDGISDALQAYLDDYLTRVAGQVLDKGVAGGVAPLDEYARVPAANLPAYLDPAKVAPLGDDGRIDWTNLPTALSPAELAAKYVMRGALRKHLSDFGAVGDGVTDDTAALQAAADYLRDYAVTDPPLMRPVQVSGHGGVYKVTASVDFTGITLGRGWGLEDVNVLGACAGKTALDFIGSRFGDLRRVRVWGDINNQPHTGILMAADVNFAPCSNFTLDRVTTDGYFTSSGFHMAGAEENNFRDCVFDNRRVGDAGGEAWAAIIDGAGYKPIRSDYAAPITSRGSFTVNKFTRCSFRKPFGIVGPSIFLQDVSSIGFDQCYITNGGGSAIVWRLTSYVPYRVSFDVQLETSGIDRFIQFTSDAAAAREVRDLSMRFGNVFCDQEILAADTLTGLTLNGCQMRVPTLAVGVTLANGVINPSLASKLTMKGADVVVPSLSTFPAESAFAAFAGRVVGMDGQAATYEDGWTAYTPVLANWSKGNGTVTGAYRRTGRTVQYRVRYVVGSTDVPNSILLVSLPVPASTGITGVPRGAAHLLDTSAAAHYNRFVCHASLTQVYVADATDARVAPATPFTWAAGDTIDIVGVYESAKV